VSAPAFELVAAPVTPFDASGDLALDVVAPLAAHLRATGVDGVFVAGSTGEGPSLTGAERRLLTERWVAVAEGLRVIVQVGHQSTREARELMRHAAEAGAHAACAAPPCWFGITSPRQLADTCAEVAAGAPELPFFYYHIPSLSGIHVPMAPFLDLVRERIPRFAGIKYSHHDPLDFQACVRAHGESIQLLWGLDEALAAGLALGARGAVGTTYNLAAPLYRRLIAAHARGDNATVQTLQSRAALLVETLLRCDLVAGTKTVLRLLGVDCGTVRAPLMPLGAEQETELRAELEQMGFFDWMRPAG
jgi:N-acetylneuraminate lyase